MKVVILAGGMGTRIADDLNPVPKPMLEIGGMPIIWHIMKGYSYYGYNDFIICAGYKQHLIKEWFADYFLHTCDITFDFTQGNQMTIHNQRSEPWQVTIVDTGHSTMTGGRIKRIKSYIGDDSFMMTYGDGVCDVNITELVKFHHEHGKIATITAVMQEQLKGVLEIDHSKSVKSYRKKSINDSIPINAGFMVLGNEIFDLLVDDSTGFEADALETLAEQGELKSYMHHGFWQCMDTAYEKKMLETLWEEGVAKWKKW
ncbi:MAG: glucose-1-phosphate cytidylyltransferase [Lachnospiraceae bacterium]|jgi:glucose-1-phosphate cytidylyltransferase|nr:glucose-1-phosphate cytidylyltransferase [Lachnospiraceae bacterium]